MAYTLNNVLNDIYMESSAGVARCGLGDSRAYSAKDKVLRMIIPAEENEFEVPIFAMPAVVHIGQAILSVDKVVLNIAEGDKFSSYASLEKNVIEAFRRSSLACDMRKIISKDKSLMVVYYAARGIITDASLDPMLVASWKVKKPPHSGSIECITPILRINPKCFVENSDTMMRFLAKKMIASAASASYLDMNNIQIIVGNEMPFQIRSAYQPKIDTTNEELRRLAIEGLNESIDVYS